MIECLNVRMLECGNIAEASTVTRATTASIASIASKGVIWKFENTPLLSDSRIANLRCNEYSKGIEASRLSVCFA